MLANLKHKLELSFRNCVDNDLIERLVELDGFGRANVDYPEFKIFPFDEEHKKKKKRF